MGRTQTKQEPLFDLIRSMSKAEKRNFKLYATRLSGNQEAKFLTLFDCLDAMEEYDQGRVLQRCPITKSQLPNTKGHLYRQILVTLRLLNVNRNTPMQLREQLDMAQILFDKGLYRQSEKVIERSREEAIELEQYSVAIELLEMQKRIEVLYHSKEMALHSDALKRTELQLARELTTRITLSNIISQLYGLYLQLGYTRSQRDINLIVQIFEPQLQGFDFYQLPLTQQILYAQARAWYHYILHELLTCYRWARRWVDLFEANPAMRLLHYDVYLKGAFRLLEGLYLLRDHRRFVQVLEEFEKGSEDLAELNVNACMLRLYVLHTQEMNRLLYEGRFEEGVAMVPEMEAYLAAYPMLDIRYRMVIHYKIACFYFGQEEYLRSIAYLGRIIDVKDRHLRRDLQCYARILHLICCYESGLDHNLDYQVRSLTVYLMKMNDLQEVQQEMLAFLKRINSLYEADLREELRQLYERLKPYEDHPFERRTFYYLDVLSWLESKLEGVSVGEVIRRRFIAQSERD